MTLMLDDTLVRSANQIATFFKPYPHDEAVASVADHMAKFWEPRMREALFAYLDGDGEGLEPLAREAGETLKAQQEK